ncbi:MAG TPA: MBL fold metallo-hydrolase, partial [bacterium]|nr:MBL fold metallo-hydrolase [bacterium]
KAVVPKKEENLFTHVEEYWNEFQTKRFHDYEQQTTKVLCRSIPVWKTVAEGDALDWEGLKITVLDTPGYTRGAVSYLFESDGKRVACTGDLIYGDGKILDLYSMQDAVPELKIGAYHGYAARLHEVVDSLNRLAAAKPDLVVPARGPVIDNPAEAISKLIGRIQGAYRNYQTINAGRWYFGDDRLKAMLARVVGPDAQISWMDNAETVQKTFPDWVIPISNTRLIVSKERAGFLVDCGSEKIIERIHELIKEKQVRSIEGIYITHYHDDHTDRVPQAAREFDCPVYACEEMRDILVHPGDYRLPCLTTESIPEVRTFSHGASVTWREFEFTSCYFPGQTIYHDALLAKRSERDQMLFVGDSFTPSGIDDYCLQNRNLLHPGFGYFACLEILGQMNPNCLLTNQHVGATFRYSADQLAFMKRTLDERVDLLRDLFPWDDPNYGIDEGWASLFPYARHVEPGESGRMEIRIMNHSPHARTFTVKLNVPADWESDTEKTLEIGECQESAMEIAFKPSADVSPGLYIVTADIRCDDFSLPQWTEAMVTVGKD